MTKMLYKITIYLIYLSITTFYSGKCDIQRCQIGAPGKCNGLSTIENGLPGDNAKLIETIDSKTKNECFYACINHINCFMVFHNNLNGKCSLYSNHDYKRLQRSTYSFLIWTCCDKNNSYITKNHCPGYWNYKINSKSNNHFRLGIPLLVTKTINFFECLSLCLNNPLCGAINYYDVVNNHLIPMPCELISAFPSFDVTIDYNDRWSTYIWKCADNYQIPKPSELCHTRTDYLPGYWVESDKSASINLEMKNVLNFYTMNFSECLENCEYYPDCIKPWYSKLLYLCVLEASKLSDCSVKLNESLSINITNYRYSNYNWQPCLSFTVSNRVQNDFLFINNKFECRKILNNKDIYVYPVYCGENPILYNFNPNNLYKCNEAIKNNLEFQAQFLCQDNQAFKVIEKIGNSFRVSNGYQSYWLFNVSDINFPVVSSESQCKLYNSNYNDLNFKDLTIVSREEWFALKPSQVEPYFSNTPVKYVIITTTEYPRCSAFTLQACAATLRLNDISLRKLNFVAYPYNFMICSNGQAFEGKGWKYRSQAAGNYNPNSVSIALIGRYVNQPRTPIIIEALKKVILMGVHLGKIDPNYTVLTHNDVSVKYKVAAQGLERIIMLHPKYRGNTNKSCVKLSNFVLILNVLAILFITALMVVLSHFMYNRLIHDPLCRCICDIRINTAYSSKIRDSIEILPQIILQEKSAITKCGRLFSTITTNIYWIEDKEIFDFSKKTTNQSCACKKSVYALFDLFKFEADMLDFNNIFQVASVKYCRCILYVILERHPPEASESLIVCHFNGDLRVFQQFITRLYSGNCVCDNFFMEKYVNNVEEFEFVEHRGKLLPDHQQRILDNDNRRNGPLGKYCYMIDEHDERDYF